MSDSYISIKNLSLQRNKKPVLHNVSLQIAQGEIVCLLGPSGSGKSSLLRCINRLTEPPPETIFIDGTAITTLDPITLRQQVGMVFQTPALFSGTVAENIAYSSQLTDNPLSVAEISRLLALTDLPPEFAPRLVTELSGGEAQRVALARTLANRPKILLLDEPTSALDPASRRHIWQTISHLRQSLGLTVLWVTHDIEEVQQVADRIYLLVKGQVADQGTPDQLFQAGSTHIAAEFAAGLLE